MSVGLVKSIDETLANAPGRSMVSIALGQIVLLAKEVTQMLSNVLAGPNGGASCARYCLQLWLLCNSVAPDRNAAAH